MRSENCERLFRLAGNAADDGGGSPPHAREAFLALEEQGHEVYLWSSGGAGYAATAADLLGVVDLVAGCFDKRQEPGIPVDFAVDDDASVVEAHGGHRIKPFDGDPWDEELLRAAEVVGG